MPCDRAQCRKLPFPSTTARCDQDCDRSRQLLAVEPPLHSHPLASLTERAFFWQRRDHAEYWYVHHRPSPDDKSVVDSLSAS